MRSGSRLRFGVRQLCLAAAAAMAFGAAGTPTALAASPAQAGKVTITGTITDGTTGAGVGGMCVYATWFIPPHFADTVGPATTAADGTYSISMPFNDGVHASIYMTANPGCGSGPNWQSTAYPDEFGVTAPSTTSGIDMTTFPAGKVRGRLTDAQTGAPIANARLDAVALTPGARSSETWTNSDGTYVLAQVAAGVNNISIAANGYMAEWMHRQPDQAHALNVQVVAGGTTVVNDSPARANQITGLVTDKVTGAPLKGITVEFHQLAATWTVVDVAYATTNALGQYTLHNVGVGTYAVCFSDPRQQLHASRCYRGRPFDPAQALPVHTYGFGNVVRGIDQPLPLLRPTA